MTIAAKIGIGLGVINVLVIAMALGIAFDSGAAGYIATCMTILVMGVSVVVGFGVVKINRVLRHLATEIASGAKLVAEAAGQVSQSSHSLAQGTSEQAASLQQTSASAEEINSMTQRNLENARAASDETTHVGALLQETQGRLDDMLASMQDINASSEKISRIIKVIDEIAFQTNILALNAAVEAARAGEAGMGFAVVADEVRNLAQRCAQAARDTAQLIEESITRSGEGKHKLDEVTTSIRKVVDNSERVKILANEVHLGSQEQARGIQQISRAVVQMQQLTQTSAASAEEGAAAGEQMSSQATTLSDAVRNLRQVVGADEGSTRSERPQVARKEVVRRQPKTGPSLATVSRNIPARTTTTARTSVNQVAAQPVPAPAAPARTVAPAPVPVGAAAHLALPLDDDFKDF